MIRTVFALATAPAKSALAVIRVSGPHAVSALQLVSGEAVKPFRANFRKIIDPVTKTAIDQAVIMYFPKPKSYTMEDTVEFQTHGSLAVTRKLLSLLSVLPHLHPAIPGEFTHQALLNGRLDSLQVEGLSDLLRAETDWQLTQAMSHLEGSATKVYEDWRRRIIRTMAQCEAWIDFEEPEEDKHLESKIDHEIQSLLSEMQRHLSCAYLSKPLAVALLGPPNSGKSSLLNAFAREDIAIVSPTPGTTRDVNRATLDIGGLPVTIYDTAGLRKTQDPVELEGQRRALKTQKAALIRVCVLDSSELLVRDESYMIPFELPMEKPDLVIVNKDDLQVNPRKGTVIWGEQIVECLHTSCLSGEGITTVIQWLGERLKRERPPDGTVLITRERHKLHIEECVSHLQTCLCHSLSFDMKSEELREAMKCIGRVAGRVDAEEVLDQVFKEFCIGK